MTTLAVHCFISDLMYTDVARYVESVSMAVAAAGVASSVAVTLVFDTLDKLEVALHANENLLLNATAQVTNPLASLDPFIRDTKAWQLALLYPETVLLIALALAPASKEEVQPKIVAVTAISQIP